MTGLPRAKTLGLVGCHACRLVCAPPAAHDDSRCPRCGTPLHQRQPHSLARAWALLLAGVIFYVPANLLPVMHTNMLGSGSDSTILEGVIEFWQSGSYGIALVIFIASVAVPCSKFLILGLLLLTAQRRSGWARHERTRLYRLVELVGYWSMLDVVVVGVVAGLVKFQALADIEPRLGILFFGAVVILTMLAAMQFDPRLIWDGETHERNS
ncbi:paraquat-inducible protein A [Luteibacter sp. UNCMF366Tsu5.1]|uniref:paraquat-inducible protein A n=1 Tax=Luteibacter sp. UNCMF366Tsu5.1 TaxID=1502758 RepID=UPI000908F0B8|nr:paraquat-inducible protein A [Luteibacter sp. UNCMF366Tsu5.1]SFW57314.1 paraquat-inducible protein A [Luteibacter sp. UNCMF366Tsu5.1]